MTTASLRLMYYWQNLGQASTLNAYQLLKDQKIGAPFHDCKDAGDMCRFISKDNFNTKLLPGLQTLANIALTIPLSTVWPERGFSILSRVKTKQCNRMLDSTSCAAVINMNGLSAL